ncbi:MAG TPA: Mur ligase family protein [Candidatus Paceibacterota bacterium]
MIDITLLNRAKKLYFVGIGGIGVSAIASMTLAEGKQIFGSDFTDSELIQNLRTKGAKISIGQDINDIPKDTDFIIYSTAIKVADPDFYDKLKTLPIPSISYAEALSIISQGKFTIAISGTHGKTTTTGMIAKILMDAGFDPSVIIGSIFKETNSNFVIGKSGYLVVEVDEYQRKFLTIFPKILVVNNIDEDHLDYFKDLADIQGAFAEFTARVPTDGVVITDFSHKNIGPIVRATKAIMIDYNSVPIDDLNMKFPGEHNRSNARAALAVACALGIDLKKAIESLNEFTGTWRRFEYLGKTKNGALVYDDYAHNPQKLQAVLSGAREFFPKERLIAVFQPHLYSRTKTLLKELSKSFVDADLIVLAPIFPAREAPDLTISSDILADELRAKHPGKVIKSLKTFEELSTFLNQEGRKGDVILTIGAGDIYKVAEKIVARH